MTKKLKLIALALLATLFIQAQPATEIQKLLASDGAERDYFGTSVSISGDYAIVGADQYAISYGVAYIYYNNSGIWEEQAKLTNSDRAWGDAFGKSVCIDGDVVIVGAYLDDDNDGASGSAYIFTKPAGGWTDMTETAKLTPTDGALRYFFGASVSISGDVAVVGSYGHGGSGIFTGKAYIFEKPSGGWVNMTQTANLLASDAAIRDQFGASVSISGDVLIVGSRYDDDNRGSAYIFEKPVTGWDDMTETAKLTASDRAEDDYFGHSVSLSGNIAIVGAPGDDDNASLTGSAYIFEKPVSGWANMNQTAKLTASDGAERDQLGSSVFISGDFAIAGAVGDDDNGYNAGAAYLFEKPVGGWTDMNQSARFTASDATGNEYFGNAVCISGNTAIIGANYDSDDVSQSGSVYIFGPEPNCTDFKVSLENSNGGQVNGGILEYREGGGNPWLVADEVATGIWCIDTERSKLGLRMTYGPQIQKVGGVPTNTDYTFQMVNVTVALEDAGSPVDGGIVKFTSGGWHEFGTTGDDGTGTGTTSKEMLPLQYTFQMKYMGDKENKTELISTSNNLITFEVADLKSIELNGLDEIRLVAYPNPFNGNATIAFSLEETQDINITVYDQTGRLIEVLQDGIQSEGNHKINWNASGVNKGVYFVRLSSNGKVVHQNVVKM